MRIATIKGLTLLLAGFWILSLMACDDDNGVAPDPGEAPQVPLLQGVDIDDSYFQNNEPEEEAFNENPEAFEPFLTAEALVTSIKAGVNQATELPRFFLLIVSQRDPEFIDGEWVWEFPFTVSGDLIDEDEDFDVEVRVTANVDENANSVDWELVFSGENTPFGTVEDFLLITANTTLDNSAGSLQFFSPESPGAPILDLTWDVNLPESRSVSISFADEDEEGEPILLGADYNEAGNDFSLIINDGTDQSPMTIEWNTDTLDGSFSTPAITCIWDESLVAECS